MNEMDTVMWGGNGRCVVVTCVFFFLRIQRQQRSAPLSTSAASDVYIRQ